MAGTEDESGRPLAGNGHDESGSSEDGESTEALQETGEGGMCSRDPTPLPSVDDFLRKSSWLRSRTKAIINDVLTEPAPLQGNIYRYMAVASNKEGKFVWVPGMYRFISIILIQVLAPPAIMWFSCTQLDWHNINHPSIFGMVRTPEFLAKFVAALFLHGFAGMQLSNLESELLADNKLRVLLMKDFTLRKVFLPKLEEGRQRTGDVEAGELRYERWLVLGKVVNAWVSITSWLALWLIFQTESSPKDVVFDSLGLAFLIKLDNVAGDMGVLSSSEWNEQAMGKYWAIVMGSSAGEQRRRNGEKSQDELRSVFIRNFLLKKVIEITGFDLRHPDRVEATKYEQEFGSGRPAPGQSHARFENKNNDGRPWFEQSWWVPDWWGKPWKSAAVKEYVQSDAFVDDLMQHCQDDREQKFRQFRLGRARFDSLARLILGLFSAVGPILFLAVSISHVGQSSAGGVPVNQTLPPINETVGYV